MLYQPVLQQAVNRQRNAVFNALQPDRSAFVTGFLVKCAQVGYSQQQLLAAIDRACHAHFAIAAEFEKCGLDRDVLQLVKFAAEPGIPALPKPVSTPTPALTSTPARNSAPLKGITIPPNKSLDPYKQETRQSYPSTFNPEGLPAQNLKGPTPAWQENRFTAPFNALKETFNGSTVDEHATGSLRINPYTGMSERVPVNTENNTIGGYLGAAGRGIAGGAGMLPGAAIDLARAATGDSTNFDYTKMMGRNVMEIPNKVLGTDYGHNVAARPDGDFGDSYIGPDEGRKFFGATANPFTGAQSLGSVAAASKYNLDQSQLPDSEGGSPLQRIGNSVMGNTLALGDAAIPLVAGGLPILRAGGAAARATGLLSKASPVATGSAVSPVATQTYMQTARNAVGNLGTLAKTKAKAYGTGAAVQGGLMSVPAAAEEIRGDANTRETQFATAHADRKYTDEVNKFNAEPPMNYGLGNSPVGNPDVNYAVSSDAYDQLIGDPKASPFTPTTQSAPEQLADAPTTPPPTTDPTAAPGEGAIPAQPTEPQPGETPAKTTTPSPLDPLFAETKKLYETMPDEAGRMIANIQGKMGQLVSGAGKAAVDAIAKTGQAPPEVEQGAIEALAGKMGMEGAMAAHASLDPWQKYALWGGIGVAGLGLVNAMVGEGGLGSWIMSLLGVGAAGLAAANGGMLGDGAKEMSESLIQGGQDATRSVQNAASSEPLSPFKQQALQTALAGGPLGAKALTMFADRNPAIAEQLDQAIGHGGIVNAGISFIGDISGQRNRLMQQRLGLSPDQSKKVLQIWKQHRDSQVR
jgi:hypothetical protein